MTACDINELQELELEILAWTDHPEEFSIKSAMKETDENFGDSYRIIYEGPNGAEVYVDGTTGGVGDIVWGEKNETFEAGNLGSCRVEFYEEDAGGRAFQSQWSSLSENAHYSFTGKKVSNELAEKIANGLAPMVFAEAAEE